MSSLAALLWTVVVIFSGACFLAGLGLVLGATATPGVIMLFSFTALLITVMSLYWKGREFPRYYDPDRGDDK